MRKDNSYIIDNIINMGYKLIGEIPNNSHGKVYIEDKEGYRYTIELGKLLRKEQKPVMISKTNIYTIHNIENFILKNNINYKLVSKDFLGDRYHLTFNCKKHGDFKMLWSNFKKGNGCKYCAIEERSNKKRENIEEVKNTFLAKGFTPLFDTYKNRDSLLEAINEEGYKILIKYSSFKYSEPLLFAPHNPYTIYNINLWLAKNMPHIKLLSKEYKSGEKLSLYCTKHNIKYNMLWGNIKKKKECPLCGIEKRSGKNNCNYNPNLTEKERLLGRKYNEYYNWRKTVFERDNFKCIICGKGGNISAHHLDGYNWCKCKRTDVDNGVTLCENCHKKFHAIYGKGDNTKEQFEEYLTII